MNCVANVLYVAPTAQEDDILNGGTYLHGHLKLFHPLSLSVFCFTEELKALLSLQMNQVKAIGPLHEWTKNSMSIRDRKGLLNIDFTEETPKLLKLREQIFNLL